MACFFGAIPSRKIPTLSLQWYRGLYYTSRVYARLKPAGSSLLGCEPPANLECRRPTRLALGNEPRSSSVAVEKRLQNSNGNFESLVWLFSCDSRNRGIIRQGFNEAALLWRAVKASSGNILEIGRNVGGSTVLLTAASCDRSVYSIDLKSKAHRACKDYLSLPENEKRVHWLVADSRKSLPNLKFGLLFIDGDHTFEGVLADVVAHWNALEQFDDSPALAAFHDALPNQNFKWRDASRTFHRFTIRLKNRIRVRQKPEIAPDYEVGVFRVCEALIEFGLAVPWGAAASMHVLRKLGDLPSNFAERVRAFSATELKIDATN